MRAKLQLHLATRTKTRRSIRLNIAALREPSRCCALSSELVHIITRSDAADSDEVASVESRWLQLRCATQTAASSVLGTTA